MSFRGLGLQRFGWEEISAERRNSPGLFHPCSWAASSPRGLKALRHWVKLWRSKILGCFVVNKPVPCNGIATIFHPAFVICPSSRIFFRLSLLTKYPVDHNRLKTQLGICPAAGAFGCVSVIKRAWLYTT